MEHKNICHTKDSNLKKFKMTKTFQGKFPLAHRYYFVCLVGLFLIFKVQASVDVQKLPYFLPWKSNKSTSRRRSSTEDKQDVFTKLSAANVKTNWVRLFGARGAYFQMRADIVTHTHTKFCIYRSDVVQFWAVRRQNFFQRVDVLVVDGLKHLGCKGWRVRIPLRKKFFTR